MFIIDDMYLSFVTLCPVQSLLCVYPVWVYCQSSMVIWCQVDKFTHTGLAEHFGQSHIYPIFMGNVSMLTHFPLEPEGDNCSSLDKIETGFEHGLDSLLTIRVKILELHASFIDPVSDLNISTSGNQHTLTFNDH